MPPDAMGWAYFWHQLPWAVPGFFTALVGFALCALALYAARPPGAQRPLRLSFALAAFGFACLGLVLGLRAVVADRETLLFWDTLLYAPVLLLGPGSAHLVYYITGRRYPFMLVAIGALWLAAGYGWYGIVKFEAFERAWHSFPFGEYPVAGIHLKPWGVAGALAYFLFAAPAFLLDRLRGHGPSIGGAAAGAGVAPSGAAKPRAQLGRAPGPTDAQRRRGERAIHWGIHLLFLLTLSNLPAFLGWSIFPGGNFSFIPMLLLAYGVFRTDFLDLNDLLFRKNGLFYFLNGLVGLTFVLLSLGAAFGLSPASYDSAYFPYVIFPLLSAFSVFGVGILVGGTNPGQRINQLGSFSLYLVGYHVITVILHSLGLDAIVVRRLEQLCYIAFSFVAVVQLRFVFLAMRVTRPRILPYLDFIAIVCAVLSPTPLLFRGYYRFEFGEVGASGPVVSAIAIVGALGAGMIVRYWYAARDRLRNRLVDLLVLYIVVTGVLMMSYLPASLGIPLYPPGALIVVPTLLLAYAVLRYGALPLQTQALRVNNRISLALLLLSPFFLLLYYPAMQDPSRPLQSVFHLAVIGGPVLLLVYQVTFLFTRPLSAQLDTMYMRLQQEKAAAEEARNLIERQKESLEYEISMARTIQEALLPRSLPTVPGVELSYRYVPAFTVGGDFVDVHYDEARGQLGLFICDVSGHGVPAALLASMVKMSLDDWPLMLSEPAMLLDSIQDRLSGKMASHFISAAACCVDLRDGTLTAANAGHPPLLLLGTGGELAVLERKGRILLDTNFDGFRNIQESRPLSPGDTLVLYTDGIPEARDGKNQFFGERELVRTLGELQQLEPDSLCAGVLQRVFAYTGTSTLDDDLTLLVLRFGPTGGSAQKG